MGAAAGAASGAAVGAAVEAAVGAAAGAAVRALGAQLGVAGWQSGCLLLYLQHYDCINCCSSQCSVFLW